MLGLWWTWRCCTASRGRGGNDDKRWRLIPLTLKHDRMLQGFVCFDAGLVVHLRYPTGFLHDSTAVQQVLDVVFRRSEEPSLDHVDIVVRDGRSRSRCSRSSSPIRLLPTLTAPVILHLRVKLFSSLPRTSTNQRPPIIIGPATPTTSATSPTILPALARTPAAFARSPAASDRRTRPWSPRWHVAIDIRWCSATAGTLAPSSRPPRFLAAVISAVRSAFDPIEQAARWALYAIE